MFMARTSLKHLLSLMKSDERPVEKQFLDELCYSIERDAASTARIPSKTYKPSGMNCIRASYYQVSGKKPDESTNSYSLIGICNSGTDTHVRIQTAVAQMKKNGFDCTYVDVADFVKQRGLDYLEIVSQTGMETKLYHKGLNLSFMCDGIILYKGKYYILELKTESSYKFASRDGVDPSHYHQGIAYSQAFGIDNVLFVYINRDVYIMKAYMFHVTDDMRNGLVKYINDCDFYVQAGTTPPKPSDVPKKACTYCLYKTMCQQDGD
jgi:CRISPR/Cas system-associated exonuclease Cas4 (RecB family)